MQIKAAVEEVRGRVPAGVRVTARAIARFLHGRDCAHWLRRDWARCPGWGTCMHVPFEQVKQRAHEAFIAAL